MVRLGKFKPFWDQRIEEKTPILLINSFFLCISRNKKIKQEVPLPCLWPSFELKDFWCHRVVKVSHTVTMGGVESVRMESCRKWVFHKTGITQNGKTQNGKT
jgi:hypothetical protein